ncbi:DgyrCDS5930 [Dimorphilus gyrociliatus]|uniref:RNA helicase n=1 Tax=Dimorphilus gyrociliatus TaxID=2664684 RepID=A0A7I8VLI1_9ANNE|nr:DgyrCDS5930 [Dimorphilus gyrociliatus]
MNTREKRNGKKKDTVAQPLKDVAKVKKSYASKELTAAAIVEQETYPRIELEEEVENNLVKLLKTNLENRLKSTVISNRLTAKKLTDVYNALFDYGFKQEQIEIAMDHVLPQGGDLIDALDWLCLNLKSDQLPKGFCHIKKTDTKPREKFQENLTNKRIETKSVKAPPKKDIESDKANMKDWILRYAEDTDSSDDESNAKKSVEENPNEKYARIDYLIAETKQKAQLAKAERNKKASKELSTKINQLMQELRTIEKHPQFNLSSVQKYEPPPEGKVPDLTSDLVHKKSSIDDDDNDDECDVGLLGFDSLECSNPEKIEKPKFQKRSFSYTRQQWTGKSPKQFLIDWLRKNLKNSPPPRFKPIQVSGSLWRSRCIVNRKDGDVEVIPDIVCENVKEAEHLASTLALFQLCGGQRIHQLLPPPYRDIWLEWKKAEEDIVQSGKEQISKPRDAFVSQLVKKLSKIKVSLSDVSNNEQDNVCNDWEDIPVSPVTTSKLNLKDPTIKARCRDILLAASKQQEYEKLLKTREQLPVYKYRDEVISAINKYDVTIICGETGSGKSTQIPHFLLQDLLVDKDFLDCNLICTQPRRISTVSLASRTALEMNTNKPGSRDSLIGYQIRFEAKTSPTMKLLYCTTGVLLRKIQNNVLLNGTSHVIIDEVHERSVDSDFLLVTLKNLVKERKRLRKPLKVILMSATLDAQKFIDYFESSDDDVRQILDVKLVSLPGRTFPVQNFFLEDIVEQTGFCPEEAEVNDNSNYVTENLSISAKGGKSFKEQVSYSTQEVEHNDLELDTTKYSAQTIQTVNRLNGILKLNLDIILETIKLIERKEEFNQVQGGILVFLPGLAHIQELYDMILYDAELSKRKHKVLPLHSTLSNDSQEEIFKYPPKGHRKIVLATNIAETGITIPDIVFVIDSGKVKENWFDENTQMSRLKEVFVSRASADQRKGRAGRVREGFCFRLYTHMRYNSMKQFTTPEILRVPLESLCLHILKCEEKDPEKILLSALDPPRPEAIRKSLSLLQEIGAVDCINMVLTPLGHHLSTLPVHVKLGRMLIFAAIFGVTEQIAIIAASMNEKSPFYVPVRKKEVAENALMNLSVSNSDQLTILNAFTKWQESRAKGRNAEKLYCDMNFIKRSTMIEIENISKELMKLVNSIGFNNDSQLIGNKLTAKDENMIKLILTGGIYPNIGQIRKIERTEGDRTPLTDCLTNQGKVLVHPSSVNKNINMDGFIIYHEKTKGEKNTFIRGTTLIDNISLLMFGGDIQVFHANQTVTVDGWIKLKVRTLAF